MRFDLVCQNVEEINGRDKCVNFTLCVDPMPGYYACEQQMLFANPSLDQKHAEFTGLTDVQTARYSSPHRSAFQANTRVKQSE